MEKNGFTQFRDPTTSEELFIPVSPKSTQRNRQNRERSRSPSRDRNQSQKFPGKNRKRKLKRMNEHSPSYPAEEYGANDYYSGSPNMMPVYNSQWGPAGNSGMPGMASTSTGGMPYPNMDPTMYGPWVPMQMNNNGNSPMPMMMNRDGSMPMMNMGSNMSMMNMDGSMPMMNMDSNMSMVNRDGNMSMMNRDGGMPMMDRDDTMPFEDRDNRTFADRNIRTFSSCVLISPRLGTPAPPTSRRPRGCKTIYVEGLPDLINEEIIREVFSDCGEIYEVRMNLRNNFCHVRFTSMDAVDQAMVLSGYRMKIDNKVDLGYCSRLNIDFAKARDDQHEYECMLRAKSREARHVEESLLPKVITKYSNLEVATIREDLKDETKFTYAIHIVNTWLERGECQKSNAAVFYTIIQSIYSLIRRLVGEKTKVEDEMAAVKEKLMAVASSNAAHYKEIERMFTYALMPKNWDHFSKPQRKHVAEWKKHTTETKLQNLDDLLEERVEDEMEMSDSEDKPEDPAKSELSRLQEEVKMLKSQLQNSKEETVSVKTESEKKLTALGDTYQLMQKNYLETKKKLDEVLKDQVSKKCDLLEIQQECTEDEARLVSVIATFLNVHPKGASIQYICSYLIEMDCNVSHKVVEKVLNKFSTIFKEESVGVGATLAKKWTFWGYKFYTIDPLL